MPLACEDHVRRARPAGVAGERAPKALAFRLVRRDERVDQQDAATHLAVHRADLPAPIPSRPPCSASSPGAQSSTATALA